MKKNTIVAPCEQIQRDFFEQYKGGMKMYTVVLKQKIEELLIFDVFKKPLFGRQRVVGNVFCRKDENGEYKATSSIYEASWKRKIRWDGGRKEYFIDEIAVGICKEYIENCD